MGNLYEMIAGVGNRSYNRVTFGAGHTNGAPATLTLFTVTGLVEMRIFAHVEQALAGASATLAVGTSITAGGLIAQTLGTDMAAGEIWHDATPDASVELSTVSAAKLVGQDVKLVIASGTLTSGRLMFTCIWKPMSDDANVKANLDLVDSEGGGSASASRSPSASLSPSASISPSASQSNSPSASLSPSSSVSPSSSSSASQSPSASLSPSASRSPSSSASPSPDLGFGL